MRAFYGFCEIRPVILWDKAILLNKGLIVVNVLMNLELSHCRWQVKCLTSRTSSDRHASSQSTTTTLTSCGSCWSTSPAKTRLALFSSTVSSCRQCDRIDADQVECRVHCDIQNKWLKYCLSGNSPDKYRTLLHCTLKLRYLWETEKLRLKADFVSRCGHSTYKTATKRKFQIVMCHQRVGDLYAHRKPQLRASSWMLYSSVLTEACRFVSKCFFIEAVVFLFIIFLVTWVYLLVCALTVMSSWP